jgi:hypothetical protein
MQRCSGFLAAQEANDSGFSKTERYFRRAVAAGAVCRVLHIDAEERPTVPAPLWAAGFFFLNCCAMMPAQPTLIMKDALYEADPAL